MALFKTIICFLLSFLNTEVQNLEIGELVNVPGPYLRQYYHDVPFDWVNDAEASLNSAVLIMSRRTLRNKLQKIRETLSDRNLTNNMPDNKFMGFMLSPYEAFRQGRAPGEQKGNWTTRWIISYCGSPFDSFCFFLFLYFILLARLLKSLRNWHPLRRHLHPSGYLNTLPKVHLADIQQSPVEKSCRPLSRWCLGFLARKFRITLSQPSSDLTEIYYRNEERTPKPDPWKTLKTISPWLKQYRRIARQDESIMVVAKKYGDRVGRSEREKNEIRSAIFQKLKEIERGIPLTPEAKFQRSHGMINRDNLKAEAKRNRYDLAMSVEKRDEQRRAAIQRVEARLKKRKEAEATGETPPSSTTDIVQNWALAGFLAGRKAKSTRLSRHSLRRE